MKKFSTSKNVYYILGFAILLVLGGIALLVWSIFDFSTDKLMATITVLFVGFTILVPLIKHSKLIFCKVSFSKDGISKFYHGKLVVFIGWQEIKKMEVMPRINRFNETKMYVQKTEFATSEYIKDMRENIYFVINFKTLAELLKYKKQFPKEIVNREVIGI